MANEDVKLLLHHLNDMYKAIGVLNSSLADISHYISPDVHTDIAKSISKIDECIEEIGSDVYLAYKNRMKK